MEASNTPPQPTPIEGLLHLPEPVHHRIPPYTPLFVFEDSTQAVVQLSFIARKGAMHTRQEKLIPYFIAKLLTEGTHTQDKGAIAARIDQYGASLYGRTTQDTIQVQLTTLAKHFHNLIPLLAELLSKPSFPKAALDLEKKLTQQDIQLREATPHALAKTKLQEKVFGHNHPYGYIIQEDDLPSITTEALHQSFATQAWHKAHVILSGCVDQKIIQATQDALSILPQAKPIEVTPPRAEPSQETLRIQTNNAVQTSIALGLPTIQRTHPEYPALYVVNTLLGGYFGARLMQNIREDKGYTYGIGSALVPLLFHSFLYISSEVKKGLAEATYQEITYEIKRLQQEILSEKELNGLRKFLNGRLLTTFDNIFTLAKRFGDVYLQDMDWAYYTKLSSTVQQIAPEQIQHIARKYLSTEHLAQVIVNE